jgi:hypothetical protein
MKVNSKPCMECKKKFTPKFRTTERHCSFECKSKTESRKESKPRLKIKPVSDKRKKLIPTYKKNRITFLEDPKNKICFVDGCGKESNTIEHRRGRVGYADDWARENNVPLYLDERFWAGCCLDHNLEFERDAEMSRKYQLSKTHGGKKEKK